MTELEKAARMALEALTYLVEHDSYETEYDGRIIHLCPSCSKQDGEHSQKCDFVRARQVITALTQALATTERKGEPVATVRTIRGVRIGYLETNLPDGTKLYTSPQVPEDMRRDAERYRWLRDEADYMCVPEGPPQVVLTDEWGDIVSLMQSAYPRGADLDAAIDTAMSTKAGGV